MSSNKKNVEPEQVTVNKENNTEPKQNTNTNSNTPSPAPAPAQTTSEGRTYLDMNTLDAENKFLLKHYLSIANPVYKKEDIKVTMKAKDGSTNEVNRKKTNFDHYEFYLVNGKKFEEWVKEKVGNEWKVDNKTKRIYKE